MARTRNTFTARVKDELAALRPAAASERRALLAGLLRFSASLHIAGTVGPRYSLVLTTESGAVARLAHWLLAGPEVKLDLRVRERGALVPRQSYEVVLTEHVEAVLAETGILRPSGALVHGLPARLVRGRAAAAGPANTGMARAATAARPTTPATNRARTLGGAADECCIGCPSLERRPCGVRASLKATGPQAGVPRTVPLSAAEVGRPPPGRVVRPARRD